MRYRALGPLTVEVDGHKVKLGGLRQQTVLAVLLSNANQVVPQDNLIDSVWAGEPPEAARATVQSYIYHLRQSLGPESILRRGDGYSIEVDADTFDVLAFEASVELGRGLLDSDPPTARRLLVEGLGMWFGRAYGDMDHPELQVEIRRLTELRVNAIAARIDADLALGRAEELVGELETLVRDYPLRERFWAQLMLALYGSGRQAESLRAYQQARTHLVDELGIEPGAELQRLEERILQQDPSLIADRIGPVASSGIVGDARAIRGYELRQAIAEDDFGLVYVAYQRSMDREVMVRAIRPEHANDPAFVGRFEREARIVANLEHPHIAPLYDYWRDPEGAFLVMPLLRGGSLHESLQKGRWNLEPALRLLDQVGSALAYAHRRGVLHRDLNPDNVILDEDGNAYLADFGIAARLTDTTEAPRRSFPGYIPPEELAGERGTISSDVYRLGALTFHMLSGVPPPETLPLPDLGEARPLTQAGLAEAVARATAADPADRFDRVEDFLREVRRTTGIDVVTGSEMVNVTAEPIRNPYKGLRAFGEEDGIDFHGRAALVDELMQRVAAHPLVTVVGPSGSGKSSLVRAGLIPALRAGGIAGARDWLITDMFPGSYPFEELEAALSRVAVDRPSGLLAELAEPHGLLRVSKRILPGEDSTLLILIDQFEELFSRVRSEDVRRRFLDNLVAIARDERSRIRIVTTMRADFLDRPLEYGDFTEAIADGIVVVGPPTRDGLAQAVAAPARAVGLELEPGLVGRITSDVLGEPGALPLLQHALTEMFSRREGPALTIAGYEATGGVAGALGRRAEELYGGLSPAGQQAAHEIFLRLVMVDEFAADTRRRARQSELLSLGVDRAAVESVLSAYAGFRLLTFDRDPVTRSPTVEVAHEALLSEWARLREWIDDARESLALARRVSDSAREWIRSERDTSYLLRGSRLDDVAGWASDPGVVLTSEETEYIAASVGNRETERAASRRRRRRTVVSLAVGLALVSLLAVVAFVQRGVAEREALRARVRELAVVSGSHLEQNPELALLVAVEAFDESIRAGGEPMVEAASAIAQAIRDWRLIGRYPSGELFLPVASPGGSLIATASVQSPPDVDLVDTGGLPVGTLVGPDHPGAIAWTGEFHPAEDAIAVAYVLGEGLYPEGLPDGVPDVVVFDARDGTALQQFDLKAGATEVSFSPSGTWLAVSSGREVRVFDWDEGVEISRLMSPARVGRPYFLDDNRVLVPVEGSGFATYTIDDGHLVDEKLVADLSLITAADANRTRLAYRAGDRVGVIDLSSGDVIFDREAPWVIALALDPDGSRLAYSGFDSNIYVVPINGEGAGLELAGTLANVQALRFVDSERLLSYGEDALLWDVSPAGPDELGAIALTEEQWGFQISPDMQTLSYYVSAGLGVSPTNDPADGMRLVDLESGNETLVVEREIMSITAGYRQVSPDFTMVGSLTQEGVSTVRRLPSWEVVRRFEDCRNPMALTPDNGRVLLTGWVCADTAPADGPAESEVVEMDSGEAILTIPYRTIWSASFNPAGLYAAGRYLIATDQLSLEVWDVLGRESIGSLAASELGDVGGLMILSFDPTGRYVVGGTTAGTVWVLDMERVVGGVGLMDAIVFSRQAHAGAAPVPALSADGVVATAGFDGIVRLWDLDSGNLLLEFEAEMGTPVVRFTPDGTHLLYPHRGAIRRIPVDAHELREMAAQLLTRDFLPDECSRYSRQERCDALEG